MSSTRWACRRALVDVDGDGAAEQVHVARRRPGWWPPRGSAGCSSAPGPGSTGPHSRWSRSAVAGSSPNRRLRSATARVRLHSPLVRLSRQGSSTGAGSSIVCSACLSDALRPPTGAAARCCGRRRCRRGGCSAPARRAGCRLGSGMPMSSAMTRSPPPGAQRPDPVGLVEVCRRATPASPAPPKQVQPSPGSFASSAFAVVDVLGLDLRHDDVVDDRGVVGRDLHAAHELVGLEPRVDEEAPVVVGARALGCLGV